MSRTSVDRPVWRSFRPRFLARAADHVRAGGSAAIMEPEGRIEMLFGVDAKGKISQLGLWSLLALEQQRYRRVKQGDAKGLATARVARDFEGVVRGFCERDAVHPGPTRRLQLDCLACAACCHDSFVVLDDDDLSRFREAGRGDLTRRPYVRRARDGRVTLRFAKDGRCQHLAGDNKCAIYAIRPFNCSVFPVGSEACLAAREQTLGKVDGARRGA